LASANASILLDALPRYDCLASYASLFSTLRGAVEGCSTQAQIFS
jgi:hypothetical protein